MKAQNLIRNATGMGVLGLMVALAISCGTDKASEPTVVSTSPYTVEFLNSTSAIVAGESAEIAVRVLWAGEVAAGVGVRFSGVGNHVAGTFSPETVVTDNLGEATTTYTPYSYVSGRVDMKLTIAESSIEYIPMVIIPAGDLTGGPLAVQLAAAETSLQADGISTTTLTVTVLREGVPTQGEIVTLVAGEQFEDRDYNGFFSQGDTLLSDADADGEWDAIGSVAGSVTTGSLGSATATYTSGTQEATVYVRATIDSVYASAVITLHHGSSNLSLEIEKVEMLADGVSTALVQATVVDDMNNGLAGKLVRFTAGEPFVDVDGDGFYTAGIDTYTDTNSSGAWDVMGQINPSTANTFSNGDATVTFTAGRVVGDAVIYASTQEGYITATVTLLELPRIEGADWIWTPETVLANGVATTELAMTCQDINGSPIAGKEVSFVASVGTIEASGVADADGIVRVTYTAPSAAAAVTITASADDWSAAIPLEAVELPAVASIDLEVSEGQIFSNGTGGQVWTSEITASCFDASDDPEPAGAEITFEITSGPGGGEGFTPDGASLVTLRTDEDGQVKVSLAAGSEPGWIEIEVRAGTATRSVSIEILEAIREIHFVALPPELWVYGVGMTDHSVLQATCYLAPGVSAPAGIPVTFILLSGPGGGEVLLDEESGVTTVTVRTDVNGIARAGLRSGSVSGPLEVRVEAGDVYEVLRLGISSGPPTGVYCGDERDQDDPTLWHITATVHDVYHNPAPNGTVVVFIANTGLIGTGTGTGSTQTVDGVAYAEFRSFLHYGVARIECLTDESVGCELTIDLSSHTEEPGPITSIAMGLSATEIMVKDTGGISQVQIHATCYDKDSQPVGRDRNVYFEIVSGPAGGEGLQGEGWGPVAVLTNENSQAIVTLASGTISGTVSIVARADSVEASEAALVSINSGPAFYISVGARPLNIRGWDIIGAQSDITVYVSDKYNNPVMNNTVVYFTCDEGIMRGNYESYQSLASSITEGGVAIGKYFSGLPRDDGQVIIYASTSGGAVVGVGGLISSGPPASVEFVAPPEPVDLVADGLAQVKFYVEVLDINGNYVMEGETIEFACNYGAVSTSAYTFDGVTGSIASGTLTSQVLSRDASVTTPDDGIGAVAEVRAIAGLSGNYNDVLHVTFLTTEAFQNNCTFDISGSVRRGSQEPAVVIIKDRYGNPLGGHLLSVNTTGGTLPATVTTDMWGSANMLFSAPADSGETAVITITDIDPDRGGIILSATTKTN